MQIQVACNDTIPCVQWNGTSCLEIAVCFPKECNTADLTAYHLSIHSANRNNYIHMEEIRVSCDDGYEFENDEESVILQCRTGKWHSRSGERIPKCLKYFDCLSELMPNVRLSGDNTRLNANGTVTIEHDSLARCETVFYFFFLWNDSCHFENITLIVVVHTFSLAAST